MKGSKNLKCSGEERGRLVNYACYHYPDELQASQPGIGLILAPSHLNPYPMPLMHLLVPWQVMLLVTLIPLNFRILSLSLGITHCDIFPYLILPIFSDSV
jgi:hypothetical protein